MISMELDKLGNVALLDARTLKPLDVFDIFFGTYVRPVGSKPASVLALLEGVFTPIFITPDGDLTALDIACQLCQRMVTAFERFTVRTHAAHPACALIVAEEGAVRDLDSVPVVWADGRPGEGHDFPLVYHLRDLAARLDGGPSLVSTALS